MDPSSTDPISGVSPSSVADSDQQSSDTNHTDQFNHINVNDGSMIDIGSQYPAVGRSDSPFSFSQAHADLSVDFGIESFMHPPTEPLPTPTPSKPVFSPPETSPDSFSFAPQQSSENTDSSTSQLPLDTSQPSSSPRDQPSSSTTTDSNTSSQTPVEKPNVPSDAIEFKAQKKGGNIKNWKSRHFVFEPSQATLTYYADATKKERKGALDLTTCTGVGPVRHDRIPHTLGLKTKDRLWVLAFDSADLMGRIQTSLHSVVPNCLEEREVPHSTFGKFMRSFEGLTSKKDAKKDTKDAKDKSNKSTSPSKIAGQATSSNETREVTITAMTPEPTPESAIKSTQQNYGSTAAHANEKAALPKLNANLSRMKEYTGKEWTLDCDMSVIRSVLESDHPSRRDHPGDIIYDGFMGAMASRLQDFCEIPLYREVINHKCTGRIAFKISEDAAALAVNPKCPHFRLDSGLLTIVCHRSLLVADLIDFGQDLLDVLSLDESLHICSVKDIEDHKPAIKSCLIKIQAAFSVTYQFECDYTEGFKILKHCSPQIAEKWKLSWGEIIYKMLDSTTSQLQKVAADATLKEKFIACTPNKSIRITILTEDPTEKERAHWTSTDAGFLAVCINASKFLPEMIPQIGTDLLVI